MADGGSVVTGPAVRAALRAVGARAFTWDKEIFVDEDFNPNDAKDQALYAHERFHQTHSGGADVSTGHTSSVEEGGAQAVERMVLHRASAGEDVGAVMRDALSSSDISSPVSRDVAQAPAASADPDATPEKSDAASALEAMIQAGRPYEEIVGVLARKCVLRLQEQREGEAVRTAQHGS